MGLGLLGSASLRLLLKQQERQLARLVQFLDEASGAWVQLRGLGKQSRRQNEVAWWLGFPESAMPSVSRQFSP